MGMFGSQFNVEKIGKRQRWDDEEPRKNKQNKKRRTKGFDKRKDILDSRMKENQDAENRG